MIRNSILVRNAAGCLLTLLLTGGVQSAPREQAPVRELSSLIQPLALNVATDRVLRVLKGSDGNIYLLDNGNNRVLVFSADWKQIRQISEVGQGPGELFDPFDFALDRENNVYVIDARRRVQWFSPQGRFLGAFRYEGECLAIAVNGSGEILMSQPALGGLATVYDRSGRRLRSIGALKPAGDSRYQAVANRVHIAVSRQDDIYLSFDHQGILQKYDSKARLQWEVSIPGKNVERLRQIFWSAIPDKSKLGMVLTTTESGISAFYVALSIYSDPGRGLLYVPLNDGGIYVSDAQGRPVQLIQRPANKRDYYNSVLIDNKGRLVASSARNGIVLVTPGKAPNSK